MLKELFEFKATERKWHLPVLAGLCVGIPIMAGYFTGRLAEGKLVSFAGLVILYLHTGSIARQMITLMSCSFGLLFSFTVGIISGFDPWVSAFILGLYAFAVHLSLFYLKLRRLPGNFFFIMIASVAICMPYDPEKVPHYVGLLALGTMGSCLLGFIYCLLTTKRIQSYSETVPLMNNKYVNLVESVTFGLFIGAALLIGRLLRLDNPYWIPASCAAVMQGVSTKHVFQRSVQRILGTVVGLMLTWAILLLNPTVFIMVLGIVVLQIIVEMLVVRNYGIAAIFITVLTIFLAESGDVLSGDPTALITSRFIDISIGSILGCIGGWILYNQKIHFLATRQIRKTRIIFSRR